MSNTTNVRQTSQHIHTTPHQLVKAFTHSKQLWSLQDILTKINPLVYYNIYTHKMTLTNDNRSYTLAHFYLAPSAFQLLH